MTAVIEEAIRLSLDSEARPAGRKPVRLVTYGRGGVHPGVDLDDNAGLLERMDSSG